MLWYRFGFTAAEVAPLSERIKFCDPYNLHNNNRVVSRQKRIGMEERLSPR